MPTASTWSLRQTRNRGHIQLARLGELLEAHGGSRYDTWVARTDVHRESQRFFRHAIPESVNMLIDERRRTFPTITKLGSDMSVPDDRLADVIALDRSSLPRPASNLPHGDT